VSGLRHKVSIHVANPLSVIAIHGMNTTSPETWQALKTQEDKSQGYCNWLSDDDMLPSAIPNSQIWTFHYNTSWLSDAPLERLSNLADKLLLTLWDIFFLPNAECVSYCDIHYLISAILKNHRMISHHYG
jgi:hypothetical protein